MKITCRLVRERFWPRPIPKSVSGALEDGRFLSLQFLCDGELLERTPSWQRAGSLVAEGVAAALLGLVRKGEILVVEIDGGRSAQKRVLGRKIELSGAEEAFLRYVLSGRARNAAFRSVRWPDGYGSRLWITPSKADLSALVRLAWDAYGIRAFIVSKAKVEAVLTAWAGVDGDRSKRLRAELPSARIVCEEWDDGGALRFFSLGLGHAALTRRIDTARIQRALARAK